MNELAPYAYISALIKHKHNISIPYYIFIIILLYDFTLNTIIQLA